MYPQLSRVRKFWVTFMQKNRFGLWRFGSLKESAFSANAQSRFASALFDGVLGAVNLVRLTLRCPSISGSNARGESRALEGRPISLKCPSRIQDGNEGVAGRNWREKCFPNEGSLICPPGKSMSFHKKETEKNWVSGQTCTAQPPQWRDQASLWGCTNGEHRRHHSRPQHLGALAQPPRDSLWREWLRLPENSITPPGPLPPEGHPPPGSEAAHCGGGGPRWTPQSSRPSAPRRTEALLLSRRVSALLYRSRGPRGGQPRGPPHISHGRPLQRHLAAVADTDAL